MPDKLLTPTRASRATSAADAHAEKTTRAAGRWVWVSRAIFAVLILGVLGFGFFLAAANASHRAELAEMSDRLAESRAEAAALYEQLLSAGEDPVVEPSGDEGPGQIGPQGVPGIQGVPGADGRPPTAQEVLDAVTLYCASVGGCRGADGAPGANGAPGADGESIVGPAGPTGPAGADGQPGAPGAAGVSVTGVSCVLRDDLSTAFRFTFSDATTVDVPGACLP